MSAQNYYLCDFCRQRVSYLYRCLICDNKRPTWSTYSVHCSSECVEEHKQKEHSAIDLV